MRKNTNMSSTMWRQGWSFNWTGNLGGILGVKQCYATDGNRFQIILMIVGTCIWLIWCLKFAIKNLPVNQGWCTVLYRSATKIGPNVWSMETGAAPLQASNTFQVCMILREMTMIIMKMTIIEFILCMETGITPLQKSNAFQVGMIVLNIVKITMIIIGIMYGDWCNTSAGE